MNHYIDDRSLFTDPSVSARAERARAWARAEQLLDDRVLESALRFASAFATYCSAANADEGQIDGAMQLLLLFVALDDAERDAVTRYVPVGDEWRALLELPWLRRWMERWGELHTSDPAVVQQFRSSLAGYMAARRLEVDLDPGRTDVDTVWKVRTQTAFVMPWIDYWRVSLGLPAGSMPDDRAANVRRLATEMVFVVNDLCSLHRDREGAGSSRDLNVVRAHARSVGSSLDAAADHFVSWYADAARELSGELAACCSNGDPSVSLECDLIGRIVDGNRPAHEALLVERYDASAGDLLARLASVTPPVSLPPR